MRRRIPQRAGGERVELVRCGQAASLRGSVLPLAQHVHQLNASQQDASAAK
jgi:hypothetical protein